MITQNSEEETIEETSSIKKKILKGHLPVKPPEKKPRTQAQIDAFERARASREANIKKREADAKRLAEYDAMMVKQKLVEKADKIKLKTMKKIETIDSISSDEDEVVIEKPKKTVPKPQTVSKPQTPTVSNPPTPKPKILPFKFV